MICRTLGPHLAALAGPFPVVFLTGPRQSGKTTLARATFPDYRYISLEDLQQRAEATEDPKGFLTRLEGTPGVIIDEAQRAPDLFSYLQAFADEHRAGPVVLTGSQHFLLSEKINQSLAGRAAIVELLPFSYAELMHREARSIDVVLGPQDMPGLLDASPAHGMDSLLVSGLYPPIHDRRVSAHRWLDAYVRTYVERDVRTLTNVGDLDGFMRFVRLCAGRSGQLLNMSALGADAGVDQSTAKRWLSLLRTSYIIDLLAPHHQNFRKRIVKTPKLYFNDSGLLCHLLGIAEPQQLQQHPLRGAIFETFVFSELRKAYLHRAEKPPLYFWRDSRGREVDIVIDRGGSLLPIEIKSGATVGADFFATLDFFTKLTGGPPGTLIYGGLQSYSRRGHRVCSWASIG